ncbi:MAG: hypothetical protein WA063_05125 [Minisyncoccia bacterium]
MNFGRSHVYHPIRRRKFRQHDFRAVDGNPAGNSRNGIREDAKIKIILLI